MAIRSGGIEAGMTGATGVPDLGAKVSVCLLAYNHAHLIGSTLRSLLEQSVSAQEIVVSDDGSTDGTWEAVLAVARSDSRVVPIRTPARLGMAGNANHAVASTTRPYVALLHHDDLCRRDLLERWAGVLERHPDAGFVFNPYAVEGTDRVDGEAMPGERIEGEWLLRRFLLPRWGCLVRGTAMIRRAAWERVGGMRTEFGMLADVDLWMRLSADGPVGYVDEPIITVRHERPDDYPAAYADSVFSWKRKKLVYDIHAANRISQPGHRTLRGRLAWTWFRIRLGAETTKWLAYALVKGKPDMLASSLDGETRHDLLPVRLLRKFLVAAAAGNRGRG